EVRRPDVEMRVPASRRGFETRLLGIWIGRKIDQQLGIHPRDLSLAGFLATESTQNTEIRERRAAPSISSPVFSVISVVNPDPYSAARTCCSAFSPTMKAGFSQAMRRTSSALQPKAFI